MVKITKKLTVPKWLKSKPASPHDKVIKDNSKEFIFMCAKRDGMDLSPKALLHEFIDHLGNDNTFFRRITKNHIRTTYPFFEAIRLELKNKLSKLEHDIDQGLVILESEK